jgi:hypothetical protein
MMQRLALAFRAYAAKQGWQPEDYRVLVYFNEEWGAIHLLLVAKEFPRKDWYERWEHVFSFLEKNLTDEPDLRRALHLVLHTFDEVAEGGLYAIGPEYEDINEFFSPLPTAPKPKKV